MKQLNLFILISFFLGICSCNEEEILIHNDDIYHDSTTNDSLFFRSESDAVFTAINTLSKIYPKDKRSSQSKKTFTVKNINNIKSNKSSSSNNPGFYIINFEEGGFAMIPNDTRATEVYAYSDRGFLQQGINDNVDYYLSLANDYLNHEIENSDKIISNIPITPIPDPNDPRNYVLVYHGEHYCHQMPISEHILGSNEFLLTTEWHQSIPYNLFCITSENLMIPAGCVAIALGQIMAYHQKPQSYNNHPYQWDLITQSETIDPLSSSAYPVAQLIYDIGVAAGANYLVGNNGATIDGACNALSAFGYNNSKTNYSFSVIVNNINQNRPCYVRGDNNTPNQTHAWVIDGYKSISKTYKYYHQSTLDLCSTATETISYVHCNWGGDSSFNGFFIDKAFNDIDGKNLSYNLQLIHNIYQ